MDARPLPRRKKIAIAVCAAAIPLSLWCFDLANRASLLSPLLRRLLGPKDHEVITSFPDYWEWDLATMLLMLAVCIASALYLVVQAANRWRRSRAVCARNGARSMSDVT